MHWYRQKPEQPLKRVLYISSNENVVHEQGISEERYEARKSPSNSLVSLRIHQATEEDAGLYYCACWVEHTLHKISAVIEQKPPSGQHVAEETERGLWGGEHTSSGISGSLYEKAKLVNESWMLAIDQVRIWM